MRQSIVWAVASAALAGAAVAQENFKRADSRRPYVHHVELLDADGRPVDPDEEFPRPYSPTQSCKVCHDLDAIAHGWHFDAASSEGESAPGEPWFLVEKRTGTVLPVSARGWDGTWKPADVGLDPVEFLVAFGSHQPGGGATYAGLADPGPRGELAMDCMACHGAGRSYSQERWNEQLQDENFAWAPTAALGLATVKGSVKRLPDGFDAGADEARKQLPKVTYDKSLFAPDGKVFFDVVRTPPNESCYACHSMQRVGPEAESRRWLHDGDVHLAAGMSCADCHGNGLHHHTVRGREGEEHPLGFDVSASSCVGCHMEAGRLGAPKPEHRGIPPLHFDAMACTSCHSGSVPEDELGTVQTSMAHELGLADQRRSWDDLPQIVEGVLLRGDDGKLRPHRMVWPSFWGVQEGESVRPLPVEDAFRALRRPLRVRRDFREEVGRAKVDAELLAEVLGERKDVPESGWTAAEHRAVLEASVARAVEPFRGKLVEALRALEDLAGDGRPVFVSGGTAWRLEGDELEAFAHPTAEPVAWPYAHDVRPARQSTGAAGCSDCHAESAPFFHATYRPLGPAPMPAGSGVRTVIAGTDLDPELMAQWEQAFTARDAFKWVGGTAVTVLGLVLLLQVLLGFEAVTRWFRPRAESLETRSS